MFTENWVVDFLRRSIKKHWQLSLKKPEFPSNVRYLYKSIIKGHSNKGIYC